MLSGGTISVNGSSQQHGSTIGAIGLIGATLKIGIISKETPGESEKDLGSGGMSQVVLGQGFTVCL